MRPRCRLLVDLPDKFDACLVWTQPTLTGECQTRARRHKPHACLQVPFLPYLLRTDIGGFIAWLGCLVTRRIHPGADVAERDAGHEHQRFSTRGHPGRVSSIASGLRRATEAVEKLTKKQKDCQRRHLSAHGMWARCFGEVALKVKALRT